MNLKPYINPLLGKRLLLTLIFTFGLIAAAGLLLMGFAALIAGLWPDTFLSSDTLVLAFVVACSIRSAWQLSKPS